MQEGVIHPLNFTSESFKANSCSVLHNYNILSDILMILGRIVQEVEKVCHVHIPQLQVPQFFSYLP